MSRGQVGQLWAERMRYLPKISADNQILIAAHLGMCARRDSMSDFHVLLKAGYNRETFW